MDDVLITSKFIPTMLANTSAVSYDLSRLITHKSSRGATGHLYLSFPPSVDTRGLRPVADPRIHPPLHIDLCSYGSPVLLLRASASGWIPPWPVTVVTRPVFISGSETGTSSVYYLSYNFSLFVSPPSFSRRSSTMFVSLPR